jgi:selenocysteine-specific elongation factor
MKYLIVGTAGHVDHGKTALIRLLTGTDTDRLKEEKTRGISIDIGFAALRYQNSLILGIVDVPGHERFLKNMLAGTGGIDLAMLVIAADEGIMPQTREHMEMLQYFGVKHGIVVLNKIDKVDAEWLELIETDIKEYLAGTFLADSPVCRISAITGTGLAALKLSLKQEAEKVEERDKKAPFRMWIDRAFNMKGQGLIVTGSVLTGTLQTGESLTLYPTAAPVKIREIETHNQESSSISAGQRASLNLAGRVLSDVGRGMFLGVDGYGQIGTVWYAVIQWKTLFPSGTRIRLHVGTGENIGRIAYRKNAEGSGLPQLVRIHLEQPIAASLGDKGILRRFSPQDLIGGVTFLATGDGGKKPQELLCRVYEAYLQRNFEEVMLMLLMLLKHPPTINEWMKMAGYVSETIVNSAIKRLLNTGKVRKAGNYYITSKKVAEIECLMTSTLLEYHRLNPSEPGLSRETLRQKIKLPSNISDWFWQECIHKNLLKVQAEFLAAPSHAREHGCNTEDLKKILVAITPEHELFDITAEWLAEKMNRPVKEIKPFFEQMIREGVIIRLQGVHVYRKTIQYIGSIIQDHFSQKETLSVGEIRDLLNTSRRFVIPVMEYFDSNNYTIRENDLRLIGPNINNLSE